MTRRPNARRTAAGRWVDVPGWASHAGLAHADSVVLVNPRSETMLGIMGGGTVHRAYDEVARHGRWQAQKEALLGLALIGVGGLLYHGARARL